MGGGRNKGKVAVKLRVKGGIRCKGIFYCGRQKTGGRKDGVKDLYGRRERQGGLLSRKNADILILYYVESLYNPKIITLEMKYKTYHLKSFK